MTDYTDWTTEQLKARRDEYIRCSCDECVVRLAEFRAEIARREGEPMQEWETLTVRADQIKVGDRFKGSAVDSQRRRTGSTVDWWFITRHDVDGTRDHVRRENELVEVERLVETVTITVELTEDEAEQVAKVWSRFDPDSAPSVYSAAAKVAEAVRKAQA